MNKKKFFATCTLVAFGASMVPAMAFATPATPSIDNSTSIAVGARSISIVGPTWLSAGDTVTVTTADSNNKEVNVKGALTVDAADSNGNIPGTFTFDDALSEGNYYVTITDTENSSSPDASSPLNLNFHVASKTAANATSVSSVVNGSIVNGGANLGLVTVPAIADTECVYKLSGLNASIPAKATHIYKNATGSNVTTLDASLLEVGAYYAINADVSAVETPTMPGAAKVFTLTQTEFDKMKAAKDLALEEVTNIAKTIPSEITVYAGDDGVGKILDTIQNMLGTKADGVTKVLADDAAAVVGVSGATLEKVIAPAAVNGTQYNSTTGIVTGSFGSGDVTLGSTPNASGTVTIAIPVPSATVKDMYAEKKVNVTVVKAPSAAVAADTYGTKNFADYNSTDNKATATFSKVGDGFDFTSKMSVVDSSVATDVTYKVKGTIGGASAFDLKDVFDAKTGKVIGLPEKDMTLTATLGMVKVSDGTTAVNGGDITVTFTIKAAGEQTDLDKATADLLDVIQRRNALITEIVKDKKIDQSESTRFAAINVELNAAVKAFEAAGGDINAAL